MDLNRNQFFLIGMVVLLLGIQFRMVHAFVLTPHCTKVLAEKTGHRMAAAIESMDQSSNGEETVAPSYPLELPDWVGYSFLSFGAVLILHSLAMKKP